MSAANTVEESAPVEAVPASRLSRPLRKLLKDKVALSALAVILLYVLAGLLAAAGLIAAGFNENVGEAYSPPGRAHLLGTDLFGRSVLDRALHGARIALVVGLVSTGIAIPIGIVFGLLAGYFRKWVDPLIMWFYTTIDSVPYILLILALALILGKGLASVCIAIGITSWVSTCRVVRGEVIRQKELDYVQAVRGLGAGSARVLFRHILPNVMHLVIIQASLIFVAAIKGEVILSYLGVGVQDQPSWGLMIDDARMELIGRGAWWQFTAATGAMFVLLLAFNVFNDALRDALDPRTEG